MKARIGKSATERRLQFSEIVEAVPLNSSRAINRGRLTVALYTRCSTDRQEAENQAVQLRRFARKQNWQIVHEYCDYESGAKSNRVEFQRMFTDASKRKFDLVLFWAR